MKLLKTPRRLKGPYDVKEIATRIEDMRAHLQLDAKQVYDLLNWSKPTWSQKVNTKGSRLSVQDVSAICAAFRELKPDWRCPVGWPFVPAIFDEMLKRH